jgi:methyl-accepting chemotaxis protein
VALAVSLYDFANNDGTGGMEGTIYRFGCALITTIVGLTCRILLINFQKEVSDNLKEVEVSFSDSVKKFRNQLRNMTQTVKKQGDLFSEAVTDTIGRTSTQLNSVVTDSSETMSTNVRDFGDTVVKTGETIIVSTSEMGDKIKSTALPSDIFARQLAEPIDDLKKRILEVNDSIGESSSSQQSVLAAAEKIKDSLIAITEVSEQVTAFVSSLDSSNQKIKELGSEVSSLKDSLVESLNSQRDMVADIQTIRSSSKSHYEEMGVLRTTLQENVKLSAEALKLTQQHLVESVEYIVGKLGTEEQNEQ